MENTDSMAKQQAVDGKAAFAGSAEPAPERDNVDAIANAAGVNLRPGKATDVKAQLEQRDADRWELDPESAQRPE